MVISIPAPTAVVLLVLLLIIGVLAGATVHARRKSSELRLKLDAARERQQEGERELFQRSALDTLKDEFVSTVSHELRTPLTSIRGALGLLSSGVFGNLDAKSQNLLRIALTNTERLIRLINDMLDLQRMDSGAAVLQVRRCSLPDLVNQAMETMSALADAGQIRLVVAPAAQALMPNVFFDADPDRVLQVLTNLFSNAIKFAPPASSVIFEVDTPPDELIFRVVDQGRGIPEDQLESIFDRFTQVDHPDARIIGGTGLGLAICRSIIQQHGGSIWAQRNMARGASLCVRLPRHQRNYDASPAVGQQAAATTKGAVGSRLAQPVSDTVGTPATDSSILICTDHAGKRATFAVQLRECGHSILEAGAPDEVLGITEKSSAQNPVKAVLIDLQMSGSQQWEVLQRLARSATTATTPRVCLRMDTDADANPESSPDPSSEDSFFFGLSQALLTERSPGRVLLVEDDLDMANVVLAGFAKKNTLVEHAATLFRAKVLCRERKPDLVILNLTLAGGDGFSLVEWLHATPESRALPLIVYSGREICDGEEPRMRRGSVMPLNQASTKPRDLERLVGIIASHNRTNEAQDMHRGRDAQQEIAVGHA